jgi:hypothetical protein
MRIFTRQASITSLLVIISCMTACGGSDAAVRNSDGIDRCALVKDDEISGAIGAHHPGSAGLDNEWGLQSCRWISTTGQHVDGFPNGWFDSIEIAVFFKERESWAREQAEGDAVQGFAKDALYDASYGQLWFDCPGSHYCAVKVRTARSEHREESARKLAQLVMNRLH